MLVFSFHPFPGTWAPAGLVDSLGRARGGDSDSVYSEAWVGQG